MKNNEHRNKKQIRLRPKFKSRWEEKVWEWLPKKHSSYETMKIPYSTTSIYNPDFIVKRKNNKDLIIEAKGYFRPEDRKKMLAVIKDNPSLDIRMLFPYDNKLNSKSKTRYSDWCKKNNVKYAIGKIPHCWLYPNTNDREYSQKYYQKNKKQILEKQHKHKLEKLYGITEEDYKTLLNKQNNCCAICKTDFKTLPRRPDVDHCHTTGRVRGLLCWTCNGGLGQFYDDVELLEKAIEYLKDGGNEILTMV